MARVDPPIADWADALKRPGAVVATGHQAFLWHPGILAKLLATQVAAERFGAKPLYLVVDQDAHDALTLELPGVEGDRLHVDTITLGSQQPDVPTGFQPAVAFDLSRVPPGRVRDALAAATGETLAQQMTHALLSLIEPVTGKFEVMYVSDLHSDSRYEALIGQMIDDARNCAEAYNGALRETGVHDVAPLQIRGERVELPLWSCLWMHRRDTLVVQGRNLPGHHIQDADLLPKALALSAVMRSLYSDLFIHGLGGEVYDRATEAWWRNWRGESLHARAIATADLRLPFDHVPVATRDDLARAIWHRHHLRHNMAPAQKRVLLDRMAATGDRAERSNLFKQMHAFNDDAIAADPAPLADAEAQIARARVGVANAVIAAKRDWCVGLYPVAELAKLRERIAARDTMPA